jgi:hypothetical protein
MMRAAGQRATAVASATSKSSTPATCSPTTTPVLRKIQKDLDSQAPDVDLYDWPEPAGGDEDPDPMCDSTRSYLDQIARYKEHQVNRQTAKKHPKLQR